MYYKNVMFVGKVRLELHFIYQQLRKMFLYHSHYYKSDKPCVEIVQTVPINRFDVNSSIRRFPETTGSQKDNFGRRQFPESTIHQKNVKIEVGKGGFRNPYFRFGDW